MYSSRLTRSVSPFFWNISPFVAVLAVKSSCTFCFDVGIPAPFECFYIFTHKLLLPLLNQTKSFSTEVLDMPIVVRYLDNTIYSSKPAIKQLAKNLVEQSWKIMRAERNGATEAVIRYVTLFVMFSLFSQSQRQ